jgi:hypothetical protein
LITARPIATRANLPIYVMRAGVPLDALIFFRRRSRESFSCVLFSSQPNQAQLKKEKSLI